jgi:hypothetical protein
MSEKLETEMKYLKEQLNEIKKVVVIQTYFLFFFLLAIIFFLLKINKL